MQAGQLHVVSIPVSVSATEGVSNSSPDQFQSAAPIDLTAILWYNSEALEGVEGYSLPLPKPSFGHQYQPFAAPSVDSLEPSNESMSNLYHQRIQSGLFSPKR